MVKTKMTYPVIREFEKYSWPGNIRELKNVIENMFVLSDGEYLNVRDIPWIGRKQKLGNQYEGRTLEEAVEEVERELLREAKEKFHTHPSDCRTFKGESIHRGP